MQHRLDAAIHQGLGAPTWDALALNVAAWSFNKSSDALVKVISLQPDGAHFLSYSYVPHLAPGTHRHACVQAHGPDIPLASFPI